MLLWHPSIRFLHCLATSCQLLTCLQWCSLPLTTWRTVSAVCIQSVCTCQVPFLHYVTWWIDITTKTSICPSRCKPTETRIVRTESNLLVALQLSCIVQVRWHRYSSPGALSRNERRSCRLSKFDTPLVVSLLSLLHFHDDLLFFITTVNIKFYIDDHCLWQGTIWSPSFHWHCLINTLNHSRHCANGISKIDDRQTRPDSWQKSVVVWLRTLGSALCSNSSYRKRKSSAAGLLAFLRSEAWGLRLSGG